MKEVKFRIWDKQNKCYISNTTKINPNADTKNCIVRERDMQGNFLGLVFGYSDNPVIFSEKGEAGGIDSYEVFDLKERFVIQQFTGLKDCKGRDIYEGDLIEFPVYIVDVDENDEPISSPYTKKAIGKVVFNEGAFEIHTKSSGEKILLRDCVKKMVISNTYEQMELMNAKFPID